MVKALTPVGDGYGLFGFRIFTPGIKTGRFAPDITVLSRDWGVTVIEVKSCRLNQIEAIEGHRWRMRNFYKPEIAPFSQAENQVWALLKMCDRDPSLRGKIPASALVALPYIERFEWCERFDCDHDSLPPILFADELGTVSIRRAIESGGCYLRNEHMRGEPLELSDDQWRSLEYAILGHRPASERTRPPKPIPKENRAQPSSPARETEHSAPRFSKRRDAHVELRAWVSEVDIEQAKVAIQIPPGPQRIRGIAGSGKTILLAQKAARMHLQHPDWDIVVVFFTRTLYGVLEPAIASWFDYWGEDAEFNPDKLKVVHAWAAIPNSECNGGYSNTLVPAVQDGEDRTQYQLSRSWASRRSVLLA